MMLQSFQLIVKQNIEVNETIADIHPVKNKENTFLILTGNRRVLELNSRSGACIELFRIDDEAILFDQQVSVLASERAELVAVFNTYGRNGIIIESRTQTVVMQFNRDDYHFEQTIFPIAFVPRGDQTLLIHGTKWNRLDITNPITGEVLTNRSDPTFQMIDYEPVSSEHYLDYFRGQLLVSPDNRWIVDNGWEWHPVGCVTGWNIPQWLENEWESEDGVSKKELWGLKEDWNDPMCWISRNEIGLVGRHNSDMLEEDEPYDARFHFRRVNVETGAIAIEFPISRGHLIYDDYLFVSSQEIGFQVYNLQTGELQFENREISIDNYHHKSKEFIRCDNDKIVIYQLITG
ncbi:hypothetical protein [Cohnella soli]|uniref:Uncharacterized protein n=1 Tax=Cohnella soli TaxID=425005 RepID=A0ABW0HZ77_9BACL